MACGADLLSSRRPKAFQSTSEARSEHFTKNADLGPANPRRRGPDYENSLRRGPPACRISANSGGTVSPLCHRRVTQMGCTAAETSPRRSSPTKRTLVPTKIIIQDCLLVSHCADKFFCLCLLVTKMYLLYI